MTDYTGPKAIGFRGPAAAVITKLFGNCVATIGCFYRATTDMNPLHTNSESKIMLRNNSKNQYPKAFMHQADLAAAQLLEHKLYRGRNERGTTDGATPPPPEIGNRYRHSNFDKTTIFIRALKAFERQHRKVRRAMLSL